MVHYKNCICIPSQIKNEVHWSLCNIISSVFILCILINPKWEECQHPWWQIKMMMHNPPGIRTQIQLVPKIKMFLLLWILYLKKKHRQVFQIIHHSHLFLLNSFLFSLFIQHSMLLYIYFSLYPTNLIFSINILDWETIKDRHIQLGLNF